MKRAPRAVLGALLAVAGCVYFNTLYNARRIFDAAETDRLTGRLDAARARYDSVVVKASDGYRSDPDGRWADQALFLLGRAHFRNGRYADAKPPLEIVAGRTADRELRFGSLLFLGAIDIEEGRRARGVLRLNEVIRELPSGPLLAEAHLWRGRMFLRTGYLGSGWWDLDRAAEADRRIEELADLERVAWGVASGDSIRARFGAQRLVLGSQGYLRADTLARLVEVAEIRWGAASAAALLAPLEDSDWPPEPRDRLRLVRARLDLVAGDTVSATEVARSVAGGSGGAAIDARLLLARVSLRRATEVEDLSRTRPILLPVSSDPRVLRTLEAIRTVELLRSRAVSRGDALPFFAAAEFARDELGAPLLARSLFLDFADAHGREAWSGKALLAALQLPGRPAEDDAIRGRLGAMPANPYVRELRSGAPTGDFEHLESELRDRLAAVLDEVSAEVAQRDVLMRARVDTVS